MLPPPPRPVSSPQPPSPLWVGKDGTGREAAGAWGSARPCLGFPQAQRPRSTALPPATPRSSQPRARSQSQLRAPHPPPPPSGGWSAGLGVGWEARVFLASAGASADPPPQAGAGVEAESLPREGRGSGTLTSGPEPIFKNSEMLCESKWSDGEKTSGRRKVILLPTSNLSSTSSQAEVTDRNRSKRLRYPQTHQKQRELNNNPKMSLKGGEQRRRPAPFPIAVTWAGVTTGSCSRTDNVGLEDPH